MQSPLPVSRRWDHPRPCGEKDVLAITFISSLGSPPPMRGKGVQIPFIAVPVGITPAHAGKSFPRPEKSPQNRDHPRPCGEKRMKKSARHCRLGSPPPMRGKAFLRGSVTLFSGITPAHAGKSTMFCSTASILRDHPRPCGEKRNQMLQNPEHPGSPPPMRGKDHVRRLTAYRLRITPAHAGKRSL